MISKVQVRWNSTSQGFLIAAIALVLPIISAVPAHAVTANTVVVSSPSQGWSTGDTRPGGTVDFVTDATAPYGTGALQVSTNDTTAAKAQFLHTTNTPLQDVKDNLSFYTRQVSASIPDGNASYQLAVDLDADGDFDTNFVYEPYWNDDDQPIQNNVWQQWDVSDGKLWSSRNFAPYYVAGAGGPPFYTISDILANNPNAIVLAFGTSVGTYNPGYIINVDGLQFGNTIYNFEKDTVAPTTAITNVTVENGNVIVTGTVNEADSLVTVGVNLVSGMAVVNANDGTWTYSAPVPNATGPYVITAYATDQAGNQGQAVFTTYTVATPQNPSAPDPNQGNQGGQGGGTPVNNAVVSTSTPALLAANNTSAVEGQAATGNDGDQTDQAVLGTQTQSDSPYDISAAAVAGDSTTKDVAAKASGFAWYWWLLIIAIVAALIWLISRFVAARRANAE